METDEAAHCGSRSAVKGMGLDGGFDGESLGAIEKWLRGDVAIVVVESPGEAAKGDAIDAEIRISSMFLHSSTR